MSKTSPLPSLKPIAQAVAIAACSALVSNGTEIQLTPVGEFRAIDGRPTNAPYWYIDGDVAQPVIEAANARVNRYVIDYDHQTLRAEKNGQPAPAAGWFSRLEWRDGVGLVGMDVEWTAAAQAMIDAGEYRYISPVMSFDPVTGHITGILMAALTNYPAIDGMDEATLAAACAKFNLSHTAALTQELPNMEALLEQLRWMLNLPVASTPEDILTNLNKLADMIKADQGTQDGVEAASVDLVALFGAQRSAIAALSAVPTAPDPAKFVPVETVKKLQEQIVALSGQVKTVSVEDMVSGAIAEGRLLPAMADWAHELGQKDIAALSAYIQNAPVLPALSGSRQSQAVVAAGVSGELTDTQAALCAAMGVTKEDFLAELKAGAQI